MPKAIVSEGWSNWGNPENEKTAYYAEYKNTGEGAGFDKRVSWSKQLTDKEAKEHSLENIFFNANAPQDSNWFKQTDARPFQWSATKN